MKDAGENDAAREGETSGIVEDSERDAGPGDSLCGREGKRVREDEKARCLCNKCSLDVPVVLVARHAEAAEASE